MTERCFIRESDEPWRSGLPRHYRVVCILRHLSSEDPVEIVHEGHTYTLRRLTNHLVECTNPHERGGRPFMILVCRPEHANALRNGYLADSDSDSDSDSEDED